MNKTDRLFDMYDELKDSLSVSVKIDHVQVSKVVLTDLIGKRNSNTCKIRDCFDRVIKDYYLSESEFDKYVVREEKLE